MTEALMWLLVQAMIFGGIGLAVVLVIRRVRYERWVQARARQQVQDGTRRRLQAMRRQGIPHDESEW